MHEISIYIYRALGQRTADRRRGLTAHMYPALDFYFNKDLESYLESLQVRSTDPNSPACWHPTSLSTPRRFSWRGRRIPGPALPGDVRTRVQCYFSFFVECSLILTYI